MQPRPRAHALSQLDAFFVAYQERTGILMQLGIEVEVKGELRRERLEQALTYLVGRWPRLGQTLHRRLTGLSWRGECHVEKMLQMADGSRAVARWRNKSIDPFSEPPFQLLCIRGRERSTLAFRAHHSVVDGEAFFELCADTLRFLARATNGETLPPPEPATEVKLGELISPARLLRQGKLAGMWRYARWLAAEAKGGQSMSLTMRAREPGDIATCERLLCGTAFDRFKARALQARVAPAWLCAAAWVRAIGDWNGSRGAASFGPVSLEVPVSLRFGRGGKGSVGNFISPLVLFGDPSQPIEKIARALQEQLKKGLRQRSHLGVPFFTAPARYLPWPLFRRLAVNTTSTGFATSHFTWLEQKANIYTEIGALSGGAFSILDHHIYTPVCLHMGAALAVAAQPEDAKLSLTHRLTAFSGADAETLLDSVIAELDGEQQKQRQAVRR
ncbi:MAG TPA: hypothetical protein VE842_02165 [Pyrinomonadaceae bacterium]|jgi:hypothetical protein|nr:hypothetical protein [Pyrinomonadaceae bacterium]